jgi:hypothetical protein
MAAKMPVGPTRIRLPDVSKIDFSKPEEIKAFAEQLNTALALALQQRPAATQPSPETLLFAPSGDTYAVTVADDGTIAATLRSKVSP